MTIDEIKKLIEVVRETGISELEVQLGENRVRIRGSVPQTPEIALQGTPVTIPAVPAVAEQSFLPPPASSGEADSASGLNEPSGQLIKSPIVGTYYDSPSPGASSFVKVGDFVEAKQVLCIIESMKLMNEIEAETAGVIVAKHVENGRPVEYGEALFTIRPR